MGRFWGRGRFSERSASPPDPLSRRAAGAWLVRFCIGGSACELDIFLIGLVVVTAADRAAATLRRGGTEPLRPLRGHLPFQGRLFVAAAQSLNGRNVRSTSSPAATFPPLSTGPSLKTERFQRGRSCGTEGNPVRDAPARLHRHKPLVMRGVRGPARRMESSPAPGSLWFLSPAGKELVRPLTHETPSSHTPNPVRVPPIHGRSIELQKY